MKKQLLLFVCILVSQLGLAINRDSVNLPPSATILYASPFCATSTLESATLTGTSGGTFSASPAGLVIDSSSGNIQPNMSTPGLYTVAYTIPAGVDPEFQTTTTVQVLPQPMATVSGSATVCIGTVTAVTITGTPNATVAYTQNGGASQTVTLSGSGMATITNIFFQTTDFCLQWVSNAGSNCITNVSSCCFITVNPNAYAGTDAQISICNTDTSPINLFNTINGEQPGGVWTRSSGTGGTFNATTGIFTPAAGTTSTSSFVYTVTGGIPCGNDTSTVTIFIGSELTILDSPPDVFTCTYFLLPPLQTGNYYTQPGGAGQMLPAGTEITFSQTIYIYAQSGSCSGEASFNVTIVPFVIPVFDTIPDQCLGTQFIQLPSTSANGISGTWSPQLLIIRFRELPFIPLRQIPTTVVLP